MANQVNLREIFDSKLRNSVFSVVSGAFSGTFGGNYEKASIEFTDDAIAQNKTDIDQYLATHEVTFFSMQQAINDICSDIIVPYLIKIRIE